MVVAGALVTSGKGTQRRVVRRSPAKNRNLTDEEFEMIEISAIRYIEVGKAA